MNLDFVNNRIFDLPLVRNEEYFPKFIELFFDSYLKIIENISGEFGEKILPHIPIIKELITCLNESTRLYFIGKTHQSYQAFEVGLNKIEKYLMIQKLVPVHCPEHDKFSESFYFRVCRGNTKVYSRQEMFMRPFEDRELISTYRYSIPGLPCIYLSGSIYTAWCELGCPDINTLQISRFEIDKSLFRLFFAQSIDSIRLFARETKVFDTFTSYFVYFPFQAICSIKVKNPNSIFKPEYIFPQFLMQWITDKNISIIEYLSTQSTNYSNSNKYKGLLCNNYAIPAQTSEPNGICQVLKSKIKLTEPISWQYLNMTNPKIINETNNQKPDNMSRLLNQIHEIELINGKKVPYSDTIFGIMENFLIDKMEAKYLD